MNNHYDDILSRIDEQPSWFDNNSVPRFGAFAPNKIANIYAREAVLAEIVCAGCGTVYRVAMDERYAELGRGLCDDIRLGQLSYGDPPNMRCCSDGPTMRSSTSRVIEYWFYDRFDWVRDASYEGPLPAEREALDVVPEVLAIARGGPTAICVDCTSERHRRTTADRLKVALSTNGRVLVVDSRTIGGLHRTSVPKAGTRCPPHTDGITYTNFESLSAAAFETVNTLLVLPDGGPSEGARQKRKDEDALLWQDAKSWLDHAAVGRTIIELRLAGRRRAVDRPAWVIDGFQVQALPVPLT